MVFADLRYVPSRPTPILSRGADYSFKQRHGNEHGSLMKIVATRWNAILVFLFGGVLLGCQGLSSGKASGSNQSTPGQITVNPSSVTFGKVDVGNNQTQPATMTNTGSSSVTVNQASVTGAGFSINGLSLPLTLPAGQSQPFSVVFTPHSAGSSNGNLAITNTGSTPTVNVVLSGNGMTDGTLSANPASLDFGSVQVGNSQPLPETLTNTGGSSLTVTQVTPTGNGYSISGLTLPLTLPAGQNQPFTVIFAPKTGGVSSGNLAIVSNGSNPNVNVPLTGNGLSAGALTANPSSVSFGNVQVGNYQTLPVTLTNSSGNTNITISQASVSGTGFSMSGLTPPVVIDPGAHYTFDVTFTPPAAGNDSGIVTITSDASNPQLTIPLAGTGTSKPQGQLSVSPTSFNFGNVNVGSYSSLPGTLSATNADVTVSSYNVSNGAFSLSGLSFPLTIPAGHNAQFTMTFTPQNSGQASGTVSFSSDASNSPTVATLSGDGVVASHSVSLTWNASTSQNISGYNVYRGTISGGPYSKINSSLDANTDYTDNNVSNGQTYYYVTTAVNSSHQESAYSNEAKAVIPKD